MKKIFRLLLLGFLFGIFWGSKSLAAEGKTVNQYPEEHFNVVSLNPGDTATYRYNFVTDHRAKWYGRVDINPHGLRAFRVQIDKYIPSPVPKYDIPTYHDFNVRTEKFHKYYGAGQAPMADAEGWWQVKITNNSPVKTTFDVHFRHSYEKIIVPDY